MSYLIQNFAYPQYLIRTNWKTRTLTLIRNYATLFTLFSSQTFLSYQNAQIWRLSVLFRNTQSSYFTRLYYVVFPQVKEIKHSPIGVNFARSAHFNSLVGVDSLFTLDDPSFFSLPTCTHTRLYPYAYGTPLAITPVAKSFYFNLLHRFFKMSLVVWFYMPSTHKFWVHYTYIVPRFRLLTFTNKYYFKIYHV